MGLKLGLGLGLGLGLVTGGALRSRARACATPSAYLRRVIRADVTGYRAQRMTGDGSARRRPLGIEGPPLGIEGPPLGMEGPPLGVRNRAVRVHGGGGVLCCPTRCAALWSRPLHALELLELGARLQRQG